MIRRACLQAKVGMGRSLSQRAAPVTRSTTASRSTLPVLSTLTDLANSCTSASTGSATKVRTASAAASTPAPNVTTPQNATRRSPLEGFAALRQLAAQVLSHGACSLPGVSIDYGVFVRIMMRAVARGCVSHEQAAFLQRGLWNGFDLGVDLFTTTLGLEEVIKLCF